MVNPENVPQYQEEIKFQGEGELLSSANMNLNTAIHLKNGGFSQPDELYKGIFEPKRLLVKKRRYTVESFTLFELEEKRFGLGGEGLWAILVTRKEVWVARRNPELSPVIIKVGGESLFSDKWSILTKLEKTEFLKLTSMAENGKIQIPGTQISIKI